MLVRDPTARCRWGGEATMGAVEGGRGWSHSRLAELEVSEECVLSSSAADGHRCVLTLGISNYSSITPLTCSATARAETISVRWAGACIDIHGSGQAS